MPTSYLALRFFEFVEGVRTDGRYSPIVRESRRLHHSVEFDLSHGSRAPEVTLRRNSHEI